MAVTITLRGGDSRSSAGGALSPSPPVFVVAGDALFPGKTLLRYRVRLRLLLHSSGLTPILPLVFFAMARAHVWPGSPAFLAWLRDHGLQIGGWLVGVWWCCWWVMGGRWGVGIPDLGLPFGPDLEGDEFLPDFQGGFSSRSCVTTTTSLTGVLVFSTGVGSSSVVLSVFWSAGVRSGLLVLCFSIGVGSGLVLFCIVVALPLCLINSIDHLPVHLNLIYKESSNRDPSPAQGGTLIIWWAGVPIVLWHVGINSPWSRLADWMSTSLACLFFGPLVVSGRFQGCLCISSIP